MWNDTQSPFAQFLAALEKASGPTQMVNTEERRVPIVELFLIGLPPVLQKIAQIRGEQIVTQDDVVRLAQRLETTLSIFFTLRFASPQAVAQIVLERVLFPAQQELATQSQKTVTFAEVFQPKMAQLLSEWLKHAAEEEKWRTVTYEEMKRLWMLRRGITVLERQPDTPWQLVLDAIRQLNTRTVDPSRSVQGMLLQLLNMSSVTARLRVWTSVPLSDAARTKLSANTALSIEGVWWQTQVFLACCNPPEADQVVREQDVQGLFARFCVPSIEELRRVLETRFPILAQQSDKWWAQELGRALQSITSEAFLTHPDRYLLIEPEQKGWTHERALAHLLGSPSDDPGYTAPDTTGLWGAIHPEGLTASEVVAIFSSKVLKPSEHRLVEWMERMKDQERRQAVQTLEGKASLSVLRRFLQKDWLTWTWARFCRIEGIVPPSCRKNVWSMLKSLQDVHLTERMIAELNALSAFLQGECVWSLDELRSCNLVVEWWLHGCGAYTQEDAFKGTIFDKAVQNFPREFVTQLILAQEVVLRSSVYQEGPEYWIKEAEQEEAPSQKGKKPPQQTGPLQRQTWSCWTSDNTIVSHLPRRDISQADLARAQRECTEEEIYVWAASFPSFGLTESLGTFTAQKAMFEKALRKADRLDE